MWQCYTETIKGVFRRNQILPGSIRNHHKASGRLRKRETRQGTSLSWEGRLCRESKLGRETRLSRETSLGLEGRLYKKSRLDRESKLNRDISLGWEGGLCRESRLCRETSLGWEGRLGRDGWLGILRYMHLSIQPNFLLSPPNLLLLFFLTWPLPRRARPCS
jgi:hypothetical protein